MWDKQDFQRQIDDLKRYCERMGLEVVKVIGEKISGAKRNEERAGIQELLTRARAKEFDTVCTAEISRLGRSPFEVQKLIEELSCLKINIHIETLNLQTLDTEGRRSPMTDLIIGVLAQFARIERESIVQRVRSGLQRAKAQGKIIGRPTGSTEENSELLLKYKPVVQDIESNISIRKIAKIHNISQNTILKVKRAMLEKAA